MVEPEKSDFESREYQEELFTQAIDKNLILYLPTGSGKTFIATLLIKHFNVNKKMKDIVHGGQRTFFLVNTVALVEQQAKQIRSQTTFSVGTYSGNMNVDLWDVSIWHSELNKNQVLVMTCQIFLDLLQHNTISLRNVNLLIFDECHRAVSNHPMRQTMMRFKDVPVSQQPRVLGLTATLVNGNTTPQTVEKELKELENTFLARIATSTNEEMVKLYSTNPVERRLSYTENPKNGVCYVLRDLILNSYIQFVSIVEIEDKILPSAGNVPSNTKLIDDQSKKRNKRLKNVVDDIKVNMDDLGVYGGSLAVLAHMVQIQQMISNSQLETANHMYHCMSSQATVIRKRFDLEMEKLGLPPKETMHFFCSDKVIKLLDILKKVKEGDAAIVFVKRRFTAKIMFYLVKKAAVIDPNLKHIKCNFIVGYNIGNPFKDTRENYLQSAQNRKIMKQFNEGELNVLFASNVVEEGIDITHCNYVIMYDLSQDFRAYMQSKGRARDKTSKYIMMISHGDDKYMSKYKSYCEVEAILKHILYGGKASNRLPPTQKELDDSLFLQMPGLEPYKPKGPNGPVVTCLSAVTLVNRYFATLKLDKFTKICPFWYLEEKLGKFKCFLELPIESLVRGIIEGTWQRTKEDAKRSVALEAVKKLYESGELDEINILPITVNDEVLNVKSFTPNVNSTEVFEKQVGEKLVQIGTKKNKRIFEKEWADCLCDCRPEANHQAYLHVLDIKPNYTPPPNNNRLIVVHQLLNMSNSFAIISSKEIPKIAPFPLYMSTGELEVNVRESFPITLERNQIEQIEEFHYALFDTMLQLAKQFLIKDTTGPNNLYLIAPIKSGATQEFLIDWDAINDFKKPFPVTKKPPDVKRMMLNITDDNYLHRIVSPWYRTVTAQKYLITRVCHDMSENSTFPTESFSSYKEYFKEKYNLEPFTQNQPLIEVRALSSKMNCTKPRALTKVLKRKLKEENEDFEVWLLPEFCVVYPVHGKYWLKAELLPSILQRISRLCIAEEIRSTIAKELGIGTVTLPKGQNWTKLKEDVCLKKKFDEEEELQQALKPLTILSKTSSPSKSVQKLWGDEEEPLDIERHMDDVTIFDIITYNNFIKRPLLALLNENESLLESMTSVSREPALKMVKPPLLRMLQNSVSCRGPEQTEVMQALTAAVANDFINCERLETLGDSFLKFVISLTLFESQPDFLEGHLTHIKGAVVGNRNLYFCGKTKNLGSLVEVQDFSPKEEWLAPGFCVEPKVKNVICAAELDPDCLSKLEIPNDERKSGILSGSTMKRLNDILFGAEDAIAKNCAFINQQALSDKNISDCVEALLGVYLKGSGLYGALRLMKWFGVTNPELLTEDIFTKKTQSPAKGKGDPNVHLQEPDYLEELLNYKFKDRCYMLQAVTHPSYSRNNITQCYQRLEFLGDALIDFLITIHIFEKCETLSPGDLTDLRSALVNNITLGALSVRHKLHKFMLYYSSKLHDCMMRFVKHQEDRNHIIDDDILFLVEEKEVNISEAVDVPKALGDIFEALVGAIYLDSGKNIDVVWKIVYNFMKNEIETFHKDIPKNHVRMLYETNCGPKFYSSVESNGAVMVRVEILHKGIMRYFNGFGDNKHQAKRAASKHAMRYIRLNAH